VVRIHSPRPIISFGSIELRRLPRVVEVYGYVDGNVRILARIYERHLKSYSDVGYKIVDRAPVQLSVRILLCLRMTAERE